MSREFYVDVKADPHAKSVLWRVTFDAFQTATVTGAIGTAITCTLTGVKSHQVYGFGKAVCHPNDELDPVFGKKKALERAIDNIDPHWATRYLRTTLWKAFWAYHDPTSPRKMYSAGNNYSSKGYNTLLGEGGESKMGKVTADTVILRG